ncbi:hypothetical protein EV581_104503 [Bacillus sp. BK006]|jgi:NAD+--asparagine ADP-ribosyltransferase|nr:NAD+--asparagine ADP-ribosyltransferase [Priestia megaterium]RCX25029.1 hypothetical protein DEU47_10342 [Bacillus sp. AG236]TCN11104.1 hypothetical protein EV581_104503 [Bacillus sp. BK006]
MFPRASQKLWRKWKSLVGAKANVEGGHNQEAVSKGTGNSSTDIPPAFKQEKFASSYESRVNQTSAQVNPRVEFEGIRGESLCTLKPPPDPKLKRIFDEAGIEGIQYKNGVPDFLPVSKAQIEIDYMLGGSGNYGGKARTYNFLKQISSWQIS